MIDKEYVERDLQLKRYAKTAQDGTHRYDWAELVKGEEGTSQVELNRDGERLVFERHDLADELGQALTDVLRSRDEKDIFSEENRQFIISLVDRVMAELKGQVDKGAKDGEQIAVEEVSRTIATTSQYWIRL